MSFIYEAEKLLTKVSSKKRKLIEALDDILFYSLSNDKIDELLEFRLTNGLKYYNTKLDDLEDIIDLFDVYSFDYNIKFSVTNTISKDVLVIMNNYRKKLLAEKLVV